MEKIERDADVGHHWPEEEPSQKITPRLSRYQRLIRFLGGAFALGAVDQSLGSPRNRGTAAPDVIGIGISGEVSREDRDGPASEG